MARNPYEPIPVRVEKVTIENDARDLKTFDLSFAQAEARRAFDFTPGQFGFLSIMGAGEAPFGIASAPSEDLVKYTVKRVGSFTTTLHELEPGAVIGMRGPWGNSYPFDRMKGKDIVVVSGGFSFTTLRSTIVYLLDPARRSQFGKVTVVYGARNARTSPCISAWTGLPAQPGPRPKASCRTCSSRSRPPPRMRWRSSVARPS
jgi:sulfhydrogenase subunit gamma (sulfur reductase)